MLNYQSITQFYTKQHARIWNVLFRSNFKGLGKTSRIVFPLKIINPEYMLIGDNVRIYHRAWLVTLKKDDDSPSLIIEDNTVIGHYAVIAAKKNVRIGKKVLIADKVYISDNLHGYEDIATPIMDQPVIYKGKVYIGDNSWIGQNVSIIGASIGKHCVVGANSVVVKDLPDYCVAAGAPATVIKKYNFETNEWQRVD